MDGDKSGESGAFLFSRRVPDFCDGRRSFQTNENSNLYRRGRRRWISLITNPPNCWVPVSLSRKFQFLAHFPFPAKFIARIRRRIVAIGRYIWDGRQKLKAPIVWDFPNIWKLGFRVTFTANGQHQISHNRKHASIISQQQSLYTELMWSF